MVAVPKRPCQFVSLLASEVWQIKASDFFSIFFTYAFRIQQKKLNSPFKCKMRFGGQS